MKARLSGNNLAHMGKKSMAAYLYSLIFLLGFFLLSPPGLAAGPTKPKNVLVIIPGAPGQPIYDESLADIRTTIRAGFGGPVNFYVEYLDRERFPDQKHLQAQIESINRKYARESLDLSITFGPGFHRLLHQYPSSVFDKIPILFLEISTVLPDVPPIDLKPGATGIVSELQLQKTFEAALLLHPATTEAFIITGSSPFDRLLDSVARVEFRKFADRIKVTYLSGLAMDELLRRVRMLPEKSIVIYVTLLKDAAGVNYYARESLKLVSEASPAPVYGIWEVYVGHGIVGGYVISNKRDASRIGQMALRILQGKDPDTIPVVRGNNCFMFDWRQLKRWAIEERRLPEGSIIVNKELTFFEAFKWYILGTVLFVIIETLLVVFLIALYRRQRRVEKQLQEAAEEWRATFDSVQDLIFILDQNLKILRVNAPTLAFLRLPAEKVLGKHCYTFMHEINEPSEGCPIGTMNQTKRHEDTEFYDPKRKAWFHVSVNPILDNAGEVTNIVHQVRDITEQKRAEGEIHRAQAELLHIERSFRINELTASLAHELNQPLAAILSNAQAALRFLESGKPDLKEFREILQDIIQDDKRAGNVIRSLRSMMKREQEEKKPVILNEVLYDVVAILHSEAVFRNVDLKTELTESLPPVLAERIQLQQVALNLIMNAAEAMSRNSIEKKKIILRTQGIDSRVRVTVRDFGKGIDPSDLERVFQPFFTTKGTGLGMGLALSKSIIEAHRGRIWGENHPEGGAIFGFELPAMDNPSPSHPMAKNSP